MKNKILYGITVFCALTVCGAIFAHADDDFHSWEESTSIDPRLYAQMDLFSAGDKSLARDYEVGFSQAIKDDIFRRSKSEVDLFRAGTCEPATYADFLDSDLIPIPAKNLRAGPAEREFEDGLVRIEATACLHNSDAKKAMSIFLNNDFRLESLSLVSSSRYEGPLLCESTSGVPLISAGTSQCMALNRLEEPGTEAVFGAIVSNTPGFQPVYFRENLVTFVDLPNGGTGASLIMYGRVENIAGIFHGIASRALQSAQRGAFSDLDRRMGQ